MVCATRNSAGVGSCRVGDQCGNRGSGRRSGASLLSTTPMGGDPDSAMFSAALNACGASYLGVVAEHASQRGLFAG